MKCKVLFQENNQQRECWLPASSTSCFQMCRRCHFYKITEILDTLTRDYRGGFLHPTNELLLNDAAFLEELLHPAREQALLNLLSSLFQENKVQFFHVIHKLKNNTVFPILITKRIQAHVPGPRCKMYREFLKDEHVFTSSDLCWNCWSCITWCLKQNNPRLLHLFRRSFLSNLNRLTLEMYINTGSRVFVDCLVSLHLLGSDHIIRLFIDYIFHHFPLEVTKSILLLFFQEPPMLYVFFQKLQNDFLPLPLRDAIVVEDFYRQIKLSIKEKTDAYKEELVMKTWHPSRLFPWCFDIQELEDFGISSRDRSLGRYEF